MITKHLEMCIQYLPKNRWFEHDEIPTPVSRNAWVCKRLVEEGILQEKIEWEIDNEKGMKDRVDFRTVTFYFFKSNCG